MTPTHAKMFANKTHYESSIEVIDNTIPQNNLDIVFPHIVSGDINVNDLVNEVVSDVLCGSADDSEIKDAKIIKVDADNPYLVRQGGESKEDALVTVFLNPIWNKWCGGELIVFESGDAVHAVSAHPGRLVISYGNNWIDIASIKHIDVPLYILQFEVV
jgi:hypothetical protein